MNPERIAIWQDILNKAQTRLDNIDTDFPAADAALRERMRNSEREAVNNARENIDFHSK